MAMGPARRDKDWLLRIENLALVRRCLRHIRLEYGVQLALDADDLLERILAYGSRSANPRLRRQTRLLGYRLRCEARSQGFELANVPVVAPRRGALNRSYASRNTARSGVTASKPPGLSD